MCSVFWFYLFWFVLKHSAAHSPHLVIVSPIHWHSVLSVLFIAMFFALALVRSLLRKPHIGCAFFWTAAFCSRSASSSIFPVCHVSCMLFIVPVGPNSCLMFFVFCVDIVPDLRSSSPIICEMYRCLAGGFRIYPICILWNSSARHVLSPSAFFPACQIF